MNILHVIPSVDPKSGGPARAVRQYANLATNFAHIVVAATNEGVETLPHKKANKHLQFDSAIDLNLFAYVGAHSYKYSRNLHSWLLNNVSNFDTVHIHAAFSIMSTLAARICQSRSVDYIFRPLGTLSDFSLNDGLSAVKRLYLKMLEKRTLELAKAIHVTSEAEKRAVKTHIDEDTPFITLGIPEDLKKYGRRSKNDDPLKLGFMSRIHPKKNLELVFKAISEVKVPVHLTIAGEGSDAYVKQLANLVKNLNINNAVHWKGFISDDEKADFFEQIDFLILCSKHENFGIAVIEALSYGRPVIISKHVDTVEFVKMHTCGLITTLQAGSIADALCKAGTMTNEEYQKMSRSAANLVEKHFSCDAIRKQLKTLYES